MVELTRLLVFGVIVGGVLCNNQQLEQQSPRGHKPPACGMIPKVKVRHRSRDPGISSFGQIPWQVTIYDKSEESFACSGALISPNWIITSGVCIPEHLSLSRYSELELRLGDWDISEQDSMQETYEHFTTSMTNFVYSPVNDQQRFALLKLKDPVPFSSYPQTMPICLPFVAVNVSGTHVDECFVSGWGLQERGGSGQDKQLETSGENKEEVEEQQEGDEELPESFDGFDATRAQERDYNSLENLDHLKPESEIPIVHNTGSGHHVPDPVEDYLDQITAEKSENQGSEGWPQQTDNEAMNENDADSIPEESVLYKHKLKYKQGKAKGAHRITQIKKEIDEEDMNEHGHVKRYLSTVRTKRWSGRRRRNRKVLYSNHAEPENAPLLKLFQVELHENCHDEQNICVSPTNGHYHMFPCMVDFGSPLFCKKTGITEGEEISASQLVGIVNARISNRECLGQMKQEKSVGVSLFSSEQLEFIRKTIAPDLV